MWKIGKDLYRLEYFDYEDIRQRVREGEHIGELAEEYHITESEILKIAGIQRA